MDRKKNLRNLLDTLPGNIHAEHTVPADFTIAGITADSKKCFANFLFVAVEGATTTSRNGHDFIDEAIKNGASALVINDSFLCDHHELPVIRTRDSRAFLASLAEAFYDFPSTKLKLIGITGTNGKTSTCFMLHSILKAAGFKPKIMGTLGMGDPEALKPLTHTTMDPLFISKTLANMVADDVTHVIMEISSHALSLKRVESLSFAAVALTNITQDHLDFHETLENYQDAKARLFFELASHNTQVVLPTLHPFGEKISSLRRLSFFDPRAKLPLTLPFFGDFHEANASLSKSLAEALDIEHQHIVMGLSLCPPIPGRLERVHHPCDRKVFVDFAHTPHALEVLLTTVRKLDARRIIVVFGCGGDRDQKKRPHMGRIAALLADTVIITDDNPRHEDPAIIRQQIRGGISKNEEIYEIADRKEAIDFAIKKAEKNDVVVIAGKGHETYQILENHYHHFSDQEVAQKILDSL